MPSEQREMGLPVVLKPQSSSQPAHQACLGKQVQPSGKREVLLRGSITPLAGGGDGCAVTEAAASRMLVAHGQFCVCVAGNSLVCVLAARTKLSGTAASAGTSMYRCWALWFLLNQAFGLGTSWWVGAVPWLVFHRRSF